MMPEAAIAFACRSAIAVSCGSVLTVDKPCACRYREIISAMSSACASVDVIATTAPSKTVFITRFPTSPAMKQHSLAPDEADIGLRGAGNGSNSVDFGWSDERPPRPPAQVREDQPYIKSDVGGGRRG